jgi:hypothetical protein
MPRLIGQSLMGQSLMGALALGPATACDSRAPASRAAEAPAPPVVIEPPPLTSSSAAVAGPESPDAAPEAASKAELEAALSGPWVSPSCGARDYERWITFDFPAFESHDRISPCPPKAACVWSGVVIRKGTAEIQGEVIHLTFADPASTPGVALPTSLTIDASRPVETSTSGATCPYHRRAGTAPPGPTSL